MDEARLARSIRGVALIDVDLHGRPAIDADAMQRFIGAGEVRVIGMRGVGADEFAAGQCAAVVLALLRQTDRDALQDVGQETAVGALATLAADLLMVKERAQRRAGGRLRREQRHQSAVAGGQVIDLAVRDEFPAEAPESARLGVMDVQLEAEDVVGTAVRAPRQKMR